MKHQSIRRMLFVIGLALCTSLVQAQLLLPDQQGRIEILKKLVPAAAKALKAGDRDQARYYLLVGASFFDGREWNAVPVEVAGAYEDLTDAAWPEEFNPDKLDTEVKSLEALVQERGPKLKELRSQAVPDIYSLPGMQIDKQFEVLKTSVAKYAEARKCAMEYAAKTPHPDIQRSGSACNTGATELINAIYCIYASDGFAQQYGKEKLLPDVFTTADTVMKKEITVPEWGMDEVTAAQLIDQGKQVQFLGQVAVWADPDNPKCKELAQKGDAMLASGKKTLQDVINAARMPKEKYKGADLEALRKRVLALHQASPDGAKEPMLRIIFCDAEWTRVQRWKDDGDDRVWEDLRYLLVASAVQQTDGTCRVFFCTYKQDWDGKKFGQLEFYGVGDSYTILKENVMK